MARIVEVPLAVTLDDYEAYAYLAPAVRDLREEARQAVPDLQKRTLWMVSATSQGGGVAEMIPTEIMLLRDLGLKANWVVLESDDPGFFELTKRLHNLIHGEGDPGLSAADRELFEAVNRSNSEEIREWLRPGDLLIVHDPQPMPVAMMLSSEVPLAALWRCHIGLDSANAQTRAVWDFLRGYAGAYSHAVFSAAEYIPDFFSTRATVIHPAVDPLTPKNREISVHKISGVLANAALTVNLGPVLTPPFERVAERVLPNGSFAPANMIEDIGLLSRPIVTQISRWDRLKGFEPLLESFALLKSRLGSRKTSSDLHRRRLELVRLVLAGPGPASIPDDPEGEEVLQGLVEHFCSLRPEVQRDVALVMLPMQSRDDNALMVNAIQRTSSLVVQNSLREGFGLTLTEAMWKGIPVLSNRRAVGPRQQVRDGLDGRLVDDPRDVESLADTLDEMLAAPEKRDAWGRSAQRRVHDNFLLFQQLGHWLRLLTETMHSAGSRLSPDPDDSREP